MCLSLLVRRPKFLLAGFREDSGEIFFWYLKRYLLRYFTQNDNISVSILWNGQRRVADSVNRTNTTIGLFLAALALSDLIASYL